MRRIVIAGVLVAVAGGAVRWWRGHRRFGTRFVNRFVNPVLVRRRLAGFGRSELGMIEHIGRRSGIRRLTPVHPEPTVDGFRIIVPLATESEWARNVLAAGHCRLQVHDVVYELDEPRLISPEDVADLPGIVRRLEAGLGFRYLALRRFKSVAGRLDVPSAPAAFPAAPLRVAVPVEAADAARASKAPVASVAEETDSTSSRAPRRGRTQRAPRRAVARR